MTTGDLDMIQETPVALVGRLEVGVSNPFERKFHVLSRHLTESIGPLDAGLQRKGDVRVVDLLDRRAGRSREPPAMTVLLLRQLSLALRDDQSG